MYFYFEYVWAKLGDASNYSSVLWALNCLYARKSAKMFLYDHLAIASVLIMKGKKYKNFFRENTSTFVEDIIFHCYIYTFFLNVNIGRLDWMFFAVQILLFLGPIVTFFFPPLTLCIWFFNIIQSLLLWSWFSLDVFTTKTTFTKDMYQWIKPWVEKFAENQAFTWSRHKVGRKN